MHSKHSIFAVLSLLFLILVQGVVHSQDFQLDGSELTFEDGERINMVQHFEQDNVGRIWFSSWGYGPDYGAFKSNNLLMYDGIKVHSLQLDKYYPASRYNKLTGISDDDILYLVSDSVRQFDANSLKALPSHGIHPETKVSSGMEGEFYMAFGQYPAKFFALWTKLNSTDYFQKYYVTRLNEEGFFVIIDTLVSRNSKMLPNLSCTKDKFYGLNNEFLNEYSLDGELLKKHKFDLSQENTLASVTTNDSGDVFVSVGPIILHPEYKKNSPSKIYVKYRGTNHFERIGNEDLQLLGKNTYLHASADHLWVYTHSFRNFNLKRIDVKTGEVLHLEEKLIEAIPELQTYSQQFTSLFTDRTGLVWLGCLEGLAHIDVSSSSMRIYMDNPKESYNCLDNRCAMRGICEDDDGNIYLSYENGIKVIDNLSRELKDLPFRIDEKDLQGLFSMSYFENNLIWSDRILDLSNGSIKTLINDKLSERVIHHLDDKAQTLWMIENHDLNTLYKYNLRSKELRAIELPFKHFIAPYEVHQIATYSPNNSLIVASARIFAEVDQESGEVLRDFSSMKIVDDPLVVLSFCIEDNTLWSYNKDNSSFFSLNLKTGEFKDEVSLASYKTKPLLVYSMLKSGDDFWLGTNNGILKVNIETKEITNFPVALKLGETEYNRSSAYKSKDGKMYFGSINGLVSFFPEHLVAENSTRTEESIFFSSISYSNAGSGEKINLNDLDDLEVIYLNHDDRFLGIEYSVSDYRKNEMLKFSTWMEGLEKGFREYGNNRKVEYTYIPPGNYTLHIRGGMHPSKYESSERILKINVAEAWYKTGKALFAYAALAIILIILIYRRLLSRQAEKAEVLKLQEMDRFKNEFFTNITHEFRTPITSILGATELMPEKTEKRDVIKRNSQRLLKLVNEILDLGKLESGEIGLKMEGLDIMKFTEFILKSFSSTLENKNIELSFKGFPEEFFMDMDRDKYQVILSNLISNAVKFTPENGWIEVLAKFENERFKLTVNDSGEGIPESEIERVFERFYQVKNRKSHKIGSGVGLALTKELVIALGGSIKAENNEKGGAKFSVEFPVTHNEELREISTSVLENNEGLLADKEETFIEVEGRPNVLVCEDDPDILNHIVDCIKDEFNVITAKNGKIGSELCLEHVPDLLVSDVMMPEMDGFELTDKVKNDKITSHIPVVLLTAKADYESRIEGLKRGADIYLPKPFGKEELLLHLHNLLVLREKIQLRFNEGKEVSQELPVEENEFVQRLKSHLEENLDDDQFGIHDICDLEAMSRMQLHRKLKALTNTSASEFIQKYKVERGREMLLKGELNVSEVAYATGFSDPGYFSKVFKKHFEVSPKDFLADRQNGA